VNLHIRDTFVTFWPSGKIRKWTLSFGALPECARSVVLEHNHPNKNAYVRAVFVFPQYGRIGVYRGAVPESMRATVAARVRLGETACAEVGDELWALLVRRKAEMRALKALQKTLESEARWRTAHG